jgi:predicted alpha/beta superfamily hydrolase
MRAKGFKWDHEIRIALPQSYAETSKAYPVLWVTDGSYWFDTAAGIVNIYEHNNGVPEMIVVGIGAQPEDDNAYEARRLYDLTSVPPYMDSDADDKRKHWKAYEAFLAKGGTSVAYGGAAEFLSLIVDQVRPVLARDYRMADDHTLMGHSAGGAFCSYAIFARPGAFDKYLCGFSGTWPDLPQLEEQYAQTHNDLPIQAYFGIAGADILSSGRTWDPFSVGRLLEKRHYPSLKLYTQIFPDDDHGSVVPMLLSRGLRNLWGGSVGSSEESRFEAK